MTWNDWLKKWEMSTISLPQNILESDWIPQNEDISAAWELYVELITRVTTQPLDEMTGDEKSALDSVFSLFSLTRQTLKNNKKCVEFMKISVSILNQVIRPFTVKWHPLSLTGAFNDFVRKKEFRNELAELQIVLRKYTEMLSDMAMVPYLDKLEEV